MSSLGVLLADTNYIQMFVYICVCMCLCVRIYTCVLCLCDCVRCVCMCMRESIQILCIQPEPAKDPKMLAATVHVLHVCA